MNEAFRSIPANIISGSHWRVYFEPTKFKATSKGFTSLKKARGFKHYLGKAFGIKSRVDWVRSQEGVKVYRV
jgi:hypothetical protein